MSEGSYSESTGRRCVLLYNFFLAPRRNSHVPEEFNDLSVIVTVSTVGGVIFGGMIGSRQMADKFIMLNQHSKFSSVMQAQVSGRQGGGAEHRLAVVMEVGLSRG